ncbi:MAG TPA: dsDNA nuclease domain-containing protein [Pseudogracilibacillus sp.]|nr:dsDNA nuclease domain-containing protein [Pseudogracilibacillus sp.]
MNTDIGGSIAIKGFNYQKASMILVMIKNFTKKDFKIIPEAKDDFEIKYEDKTYFIQVKGTKNLSISNLTRRNKTKKSDTKPSILEKSMSPGKEDDIRKLFLYSLIESTKKELTENRSYEIISPIYRFSDKQKQVIIERLQLHDSDIKRLNNQYIYITPFRNNYNDAMTFLKGTLVSEGLIADNQRAQLILGELCLQIDEKSEIKLLDIKDYEKKEINGEYLSQVFTTTEQMNYFDNILDKLNLNHLKRMKVKKEKAKIPFLYNNLKKQIKDNIQIETLSDLNDEDAIEYLIDFIKELADNCNKELLYALAIECYCELGEDIYAD